MTQTTLEVVVQRPEEAEAAYRLSLEDSNRLHLFWFISHFPACLCGLSLALRLYQDTLLVEVILGTENLCFSGAWRGRKHPRGWTTVEGEAQEGDEGNHPSILGRSTTASISNPSLALIRQNQHVRRIVGTALNAVNLEAVRL